MASPERSTGTRPTRPGGSRSARASTARTTSSSTAGRSGKQTLRGRPSRPLRASARGYVVVQPEEVVRVVLGLDLLQAREVPAQGAVDPRARWLVGPSGEVQVDL